MFIALLRVQWKWTRALVLIATVLGFAIPVASVRLLMFYQTFGRITAGDVVTAMNQAGVLYAMLAAGSGLAVAFLAWNADHKGRHAYALSLPVSRARYAAMRFGAGSLLLLLPAAGVLAGCLVAAGIAQIPDGMHAYPFSLTLRFLLASFVAFAIFFAIAASSQKASATLLASIAAVLILSVMISAMGVRANLLGTMATYLFSDPGLLSIFTGRWMLIDV
ncbi:MAG TPA: hypothetical protein VFO55_03790 [Gemmatimonadaceae bacterium]|nr:hypothetical protein [Gemmatimonadaceae bacterium]